MAAAAVVLGALVVAAAVEAVGGEELLHGEADVLEELAGVLVGAAAAGAGAVLVGHAVVEHRHEQLAVPLQADDGELAQGHKGAAVVVAHGQLAAEALAHAGGNLADVAVAAAVLAALHQLGVQDDGVHGLHHGHGHVALLQHLAVQGVDAHLGGEDLGVALAAEEDDPFVKHAQALYLHRTGAGAVGVEGDAVEKAHIHRVEAAVEHNGLHVDVRVEKLGLAPLDGLGAVENVLAGHGGVEAQILDAVLVAAAVKDLLGMDTNGLAVVLHAGNRAGYDTFGHSWNLLNSSSGCSESWEGVCLHFSLCACSRLVKNRGIQIPPEQV